VEEAVTQTEDLRVCTVSGAECEAPAGYGIGGGGGYAEGDKATRATCHACGEPVCKKCSRLRTWRGKKRRRVCQTCEETP